MFLSSTLSFVTDNQNKLSGTNMNGACWIVCQYNNYETNIWIESSFFKEFFMAESFCIYHQTP